MDNRQKRTISYWLKYFILGGVLLSAAVMIGVATVKYIRPTKAAPSDDESASVISSSEGKISKEEYEKLVDAEYKETGGMVRFGNYTKRYDVRKTTLFIGTYLIELSALNETYYRLANISKKQHKQDIEYYKSEIQTVELGKNEDDVWAELIDANLATLSTGADTAEAELDEYWISCVINEDGAFDPKTGEPKDLMGDELYDLLSLPELAPLKVKYDEIEGKAGRTDEEALHNYYTRNLLVSIDDDADPSDRKVFDAYENNGRNDITNRCDIEINALKAYYEQLSSQKDELSEDKAMVILDLYAREDARRRTEIYKFLANNDEDKDAALSMLLQMLDNRASGDADFTANEEYKTAINESINNCKESYSLYSTMLLTGGTTVISEFRYRWNNELLDLAYDGKLKTDGRPVTLLINILAINNIGAGENKMQEAELMVLQTYLVPEGIRRYENKVLTEVTKEYTNALAEGKSEDVKKDILMAQYDDAVKQMQELEFLVKSVCDRKDKDSAISFIQEQLELAALWKTLVFDDPYGPLADYCIDLYIEWLNNLYKEINDGDSDSDISGLDPNELEEAKKRADDENDPETRRQLEILEGEYGTNGGSDLDDKNGGGGDGGPAVFGYTINNMDPGELITDLGNRLEDDLKKGNYSILDAVTRNAADAGFDPDKILSDNGKTINDGDNDSSGSNNRSDDSDSSKKSGDDTSSDDDNNKNNKDNDDGSNNDGRNKKNKDNTDDTDDDNGDEGKKKKEDSTSTEDDGNQPKTDDDNKKNNSDGIDDDGAGRNKSGDTTGNDPATEGKNRKNRRDNENYGRNYGLGDEDGTGSDKPWDDISAYGKELDNKNKDGSDEDRSDSDIDKAIEEAFGKSFAELDPDAQAAVVVALNRYGKMHNAANCLAYARRMLTVIMNNKNPLVYAQYEGDGSAEYVSLGAVDHSRAYTGYRYVFIDGVDTITQIAGTASYSFAGNRVTNSEGDTKDLTGPVGYQTDDYVKRGTSFPYIDETDTMKYMVESGEYIVDTDWAIVVTATMEVQVSKIIEILTRAAS